MFDWLRRSKPSLTDFGFLDVDMHAHWLPGIDDGAKDMDECLHMLRAFAELGYSTLVATPHIMMDYYRNTPDIILGKLEEVRKAATVAGINLNLYAAAEYLLDEGFEEHLERGELLLMPDGRSVLIEFGFFSRPINLDAILFRIHIAGYIPILAHPERYTYLHGNYAFLESLREKGVKLQVNVLSLVGHHGKNVQKSATGLINGGMITYVGTDGHNLQHLQQARQLLTDRKAGLLLESSSFSNQELIPA